MKLANVFTKKFTCLANPIAKQVIFYVEGRLIFHFFRVLLSTNNSEINHHLRIVNLDDSGEVNNQIIS